MTPRTLLTRVLPALFVIVAATAFLRVKGEPVTQSDEASVRSLVQKYVDAREQQDSRKVEALFTADADQLVSSGEWRRGRAAVVRGAMASSKRTGGTRTITVESVRLLSSDVAIAEGHYDLSGLAGGRTRHMWTSIIAVRSPDGWKIAAIRNMLPAVPAPAK